MDDESEEIEENLRLDLYKAFPIVGDSHENSFSLYGICRVLTNSLFVDKGKTFATWEDQEVFEFVRELVKGVDLANTIIAGNIILKSKITIKQI